MKTLFLCLFTYHIFNLALPLQGLHTWFSPFSFYVNWNPVHAERMSISYWVNAKYWLSHRKPFTAMVLLISRTTYVLLQELWSLEQGLLQVPPWKLGKSTTTGSCAWHASCGQEGSHSAGFLQTTQTWIIQEGSFTQVMGPYCKEMVYKDGFVKGYRLQNVLWWVVCCSKYAPTT